MINFQKSDIINPHLKPNVTFNLKMIFLIGVLLIAIVMIIGLFIDYFMSRYSTHWLHGF